MEEQGIKVKARRMFGKEGMTISQVSNTLGIAFHSASRIARQMKRTHCGCGRRANHKGQCIIRVGKKESTIERVTVKEIISPVIVNLETIQLKPSSGKCCEPGCAYPAYGNGKCRAHLIDHYSAFSLSCSTMSSTYFFPERHYTRRII